MPVRDFTPGTAITPPNDGASPTSSATGGGHVRDLPLGTTFDQSPATPRTTASGLIGSVERGIAPYVVGAGVGAAAGAPFAGVGAIPGAAAGVGAVALTQLATSVYGHVAKALGWPKTATPQEMTDRVLDYAGVKRPSTAAERVTESVSGSLVSGAGMAKAADTIAEQAAPGVVKKVAETLAEKPGLQTVSSGLGGAGGQIAAELGLGPLGQFGASLLTGGLPYLPTSLPRALAGAPRAAAVEAHDAGYVLPPVEMSEKPGAASWVLGGWGGKIKTQQAASAKNQANTNALAAQALGLPKETVLTEQVFKDVRDKAGRAYQEVAKAVPLIKADSDFVKDIVGLGSSSSQAAQLYPKIMGNPDIKELINELVGNKEFPPDVGLEIVKRLRSEGNEHMKAQGDAKMQAYGLAERQAADAVDALMERNITAAGKSGIVERYRQARQQIAKSYDIENNTNVTGDVNARGLGRLRVKGRPFTGELDTIARTALAFPKSMQMPSGFGGAEPLSALDFIAAGVTAAHGHPGIAGTLLLRPVGREAVLSQPYQRGIAAPEKPTPPLPLLATPGAWSVVPPNPASGTAHPAAAGLPPNGNLAPYVDDPAFRAIVAGQAVQY